MSGAHTTLLPDLPEKVVVPVKHTDIELYSYLPKSLGMWTRVAAAMSTCCFKDLFFSHSFYVPSEGWKSTGESSCKALYFIYRSIIDFVYVSEETTPMWITQRSYFKKWCVLYNCTITIESYILSRSYITKQQSLPFFSIEINFAVTLLKRVFCTSFCDLVIYIYISKDCSPIWEENKELNYYMLSINEFF